MSMLEFFCSCLPEFPGIKVYLLSISYIALYFVQSNMTLSGFYFPSFRLLFLFN